MVIEASASPATFCFYRRVETARRSARRRHLQQCGPARLLRLAALHHEGDTAVRQQRAAGGQRDVSGPLKDSRPASWRWSSGGDHRQPFNADLRRAVPEGLGADVRDGPQQPQMPRGRRAVAIEHGVAAAGGGGRVVDADLVGVAQRHLVLSPAPRQMWRATIGERASCSARPMMAEPLVSFRKGSPLGSIWRSSKFGASKTCRLWLE